MSVSTRLLVVIGASFLGCAAISAATAMLVVEMHPAPIALLSPDRPAQPPAVTPSSSSEDVAALLRELVIAERKKQARQTVQEVASRRYRRPMAKDSPKLRADWWPQAGALADDLREP